MPGSSPEEARAHAGNDSSPVHDSTGGNMPSPLSNASEAIREAFGSFKPTEPAHFEGFFKGLPEFFGDQGQSLGNLAQRADDEMPLDKAVVEEMREVVATLNGLRDKADQLNQHFRAAHQVELERANNPRAGERAWNVQ
jgi:hypothetical protein